MAKWLERNVALEQADVCGEEGNDFPKTTMGDGGAGGGGGLKLKLWIHFLLESLQTKKANIKNYLLLFFILLNINLNLTAEDELEN